MTEILLGPTLTDGPTTKVKDKTSGKTYYKKRILSEGTFDYKTKSGEKIKLDLTAPRLQSFVKSFKDNAYDEVAFQIGHADDKDLKSRKGTLVSTEYVPGKGIDGYFELDADAATYVEKYPNFGVSPRLVLDIERADGKKFEGAIQHVAGTSMPRLTGMGPWGKVELSEDGDTDDETPVIDLSMETIEVKREVKDKVVQTKKEEGTEGQVFQLSKEEYDFFQGMKKDYDEIMGKKEEPVTPASTTTQVDLSEITKKADDALSAIATMREQAVRESWAAKKALLLSQGVPPAALDLADPVMTDVSPKVYDLSDSDGGTVKVDAKSQMLGQLELMKGMVDLSSELGHGLGGAEQDGATAEDITAWMRSQGI